MGAVSNVVEAVGDVVGGAVDAVSDVGSFIDDAVHEAGSFIDDAVNDIVPGGWATVAAVTAATMGVPTDFGLTEAGIAEGATAAAEGATGLATLPESVLSATDAFATGSELANAANTVGAATTGAFELSPNVGFNFGEFNPNTISAPGINTGSLSGMEYLGGTGSLPVGTGGLTAEQLATATDLGAVGTNAASGLGYLGGASSLPAGTAGITGVTSSGLNLNDARNIARAANNIMGSTVPAGATTSGNALAALVRGNQNPFNFGTQTPIQEKTTTVQPTYLGQLANLLKG